MLHIGIIIGSTREGRLSDQVGAYVLDQGKDSGLKLETVDLKDFALPLLGTANPEHLNVYKEKIASLDGFIFVTSEHNHSIPASLKNGIDYLRDEWANKPAGIVSFGSLGGARAAEHLRNILGEIQIADVRSHTAFSLFTDFENYSVFKPHAMHLTNLNTMFAQVKAWGEALKTIR